MIGVQLKMAKGPLAKLVRVRPNLPRRLVMNQSGFMLLSPEIKQGGVIPSCYAETHKMSPPLEWEGVPKGTKSLALSITDPDVPEEFNFSRSFAHWLVYNIPSGADGLVEGASMTAKMPSGSQELNSDFVTFKYPGLWSWLWWSLATKWFTPLCFYAVCAEVEKHRSASGCRFCRVFAGNIAGHYRAGKFYGHIWPGQRGTASRII